MVTAEKVTREDLKQMQPGESQTFKLPNAQALDSAGTTAYQMARIEDCTYLTVGLNSRHVKPITERLQRVQR